MSLKSILLAVAFFVLAGITLAVGRWVNRGETEPIRIQRDWKFIPLYAATIAWACLWSRSVLASSPRTWLMTAGTVAVVVLFVVVVLDVIENTTKLKFHATDNESFRRIGVTVKVVLLVMLIMPLAYAALGAATWIGRWVDKRL